uniref:Major facilitator superfamily (MFS) profile domain-containing protein n=1 Tax=Timema tahoe TaxID=61484 RepID=A0A7R9FH90_9NEOP|nr:unnamed protein product [Timema tahoe]
MPESPVYLMSRGRIEDARKSLRWLRGGQVSEIEREISRITESIKNNDKDKNKISIMDLFSSRGTIKAMVIGILLMANVQLCGIFAVFSYTVNIFQLSGSNLSPNLSTILTGSFLFIGVLLATFLIDRAGRKVLMIISDLVMFLCMGVLGGYFYLKNMGADVENYGWVPVASLSLHVFSLSLGVGTVPYVVIAEIFQPQYRGLGMTLSICTLWLWAFLVSKFFTALCYTLGDHGCFWLFAVICLMGAVFIHLFVPETKNRSLQSILRELNGEDYDSMKLKPLALSSASQKPVLWDGGREGERHGVDSQPTKVSFRANKNRTGLAEKSYVWKYQFSRERLLSSRIYYSIPSVDADSNPEPNVLEELCRGQHLLRWPHGLRLSTLAIDYSADDREGRSRSRIPIGCIEERMRYQMRVRTDLSWLALRFDWFSCVDDLRQSGQSRDELNLSGTAGAA